MIVKPERLEGVHPALVRVVMRVAQQADVFILEGLRTRERQERLVARGASRTMDSRHLTGDAVDLGAMLDGELRWDWPLYFDLAREVQDAAQIERVDVRWGGCWEIITGGDDPENMQSEYIDRCRSAGRSPFLDGAHFEIPR